MSELSSERGSQTHNEYFGYLKKRSVLGRLYREWWLYPRIVRLLRGEVLDFGCGIGDFIRFRPGTVGVDINPYNVDFCRCRGLDAHLIKDGGIPFPNEAFDAVTMDNVLEHIPAADVSAVLNEVSRVLRPGGMLLIGVPGIKGYAADADHKVFYDDLSLCRLMQRHGYIVHELFHMPLPFAFLGRFLRQYCTYGIFGKRH